MKLVLTRLREETGLVSLALWSDYIVHIWQKKDPVLNLVIKKKESLDGIELGAKEVVDFKKEMVLKIGFLVIGLK